jgi:hypothetical protein
MSGVRCCGTTDPSLRLSEDWRTHGDCWLAERDNWPVRIDIGGSGLYADGRDLRMHIMVESRDANSGDIRVEPQL